MQRHVCTKIKLAIIDRQGIDPGVEVGAHWRGEENQTYSRCAEGTRNGTAFSAIPLHIKVQRGGNRIWWGRWNDFARLHPDQTATHLAISQNSSGDYWSGGGAAISQNNSADNWSGGGWGNAMKTTTTFEIEDTLPYLAGFGNLHSSEAVKGALPVGQNAPQKNWNGLYTEKLSGSAFTAPRASNRQTWLYRILPSADHSKYERILHDSFDFRPRPQQFEQSPSQTRWDPFDVSEDKNFVQGLHMVAGAGDVTVKHGIGIYIYAAGKSMDKEAFFNADGEMLIVPQEGRLVSISHLS